MNVNKYLIFIIPFFIGCQNNKEKIAILEHNLMKQTETLDSIDNTIIKPFELYKNAITNKNKVNPDSAISIFKIIIRDYPNSFWSCEAYEKIRIIKNSKKSLQDVYFVIDKNSSEYIIPCDIHKLKEGDMFCICDRKSFNEREKLIEKEKKEGMYFSVVSNMSYPQIKGLDFFVESKNIAKIDSCKLNKLKLVNYKWILENSWKPLNRRLKEYSPTFKDLYFLYKIKEDEYITYKVNITLYEY